MHSRFLWLTLLMACADNGGGDDTASTHDDGGSTDGGSGDGGANDGGASDGGADGGAGDGGSGVDADRDGYTSDEDCDDSNPDINPGEREDWYDGIDQDCDGNDGDKDGDGYDALVVDGDDCDDEDATINPGAPEVPYDGEDDDCDGVDLVDVDGDGYDGFRAGGVDCDDDDAAIHPDATEVCLNGLDDDCDDVVDQCTIGSGERVDGLGEGDGVGATVIVGDINADGADDIVGGAPNAALAWVNLGPVTGTTSPATGSVLFEGDADRLGESLALGDLDKDGVVELVVGSPGRASSAGAAWLLFGPVSGSYTADSDLLGFLGREAGGQMGTGLAIGDVDEGGENDLIVSGYTMDGATAYAHAAVMLGPVTNSRDLEDADAFLVSSDSSDPGAAGSRGPQVAVGDFNGDGTDDLIFGAPQEKNAAGGAWTVHGPMSGVFELADAFGTLYGDSSDDLLGTVVATTDFTGDGRDDVLIGAPGAEGSAAGAGAAFLMAGPLDGKIPVSDAYATLLGTSGGDRFGAAVDLADVNGDGDIDIIVGAPGVDTDVSDAGTTYVVMGPVSGPIDITYADVVLAGDDAGGESGSSVSAGDTNADGATDLAIGVPGVDTGYIGLLLGAW